MEGNKDHAHLSSPLVQLRKVCTTLFTLVKKKKRQNFHLNIICAILLRWPTTVTAKEIASRQRKKTHGKRKDSRRKEELHDKKEKKHGKKGKTHGKRKKPHDKRKRLTANEKTPRLKEKTQDKREKPHSKSKRLTAKEIIIWQKK